MRLKRGVLSYKVFIIRQYKIKHNITTYKLNLKITQAISFSSIINLQHIDSNHLTMNRKIQGQESSDRLLKSKYSQKEKQRSYNNPPVPSKKITLSDLCAQQKLKVGELIKINESRKLEIIQLNEELTTVRNKFADCQIKLNQLLPLFEAKQSECRQNAQKLSRKELQLKQKARQFEKHSQECGQFKKIVQKVSKRVAQNKAIQTELPNVVNFAVQTKKHKQKIQEVQTESFCIQQDQIQVRNKRNLQSKSKQKSSSHSVSKRQQNKNKYSFSKSELQQGSQQRSQNYEHENRSREQPDNICSQEVEECFEDLTRKWMQLKEKNLSKLKNQYEESKSRFYKGVADKNIYPQEFTEDIDQPQPQKENLETDQIDQNQLNRLLKSKNFSASRLLTSKGLMNQSQNQRKNSYHNSGKNSQIQKLNPLKEKRKAIKLSKQYKIDPNQNSKITSQIKIKQNPPQNIQNLQKYEKQLLLTNYYQNDLMDLVEQLDR